MKILVTGITGFLGKEFLKKIIIDKENEYVLLVRTASISKISSLVDNYSHIKIEKGSLKSTQLFKDRDLFSKYKNEINKVIHLAALYDLGAQADSLYLANVIGTQNVLYFCGHCKNLSALDYASTIAVAGNWNGPYSEDDFDLGQGFDNPYAKTKFQSEGLVRKFCKEKKGLSTRIIRFGVIVGDSMTGAISKTDGPYYFFANIGKLFQLAPVLKKLTFIPFPFKAKAHFPIVPVDTASDLLAAKPLKPNDMEVIHCLVKDPPSMKIFLDDFLSSIDVSFKIIPIPKHDLLAKLFSPFSIPKALLNYLYMPTQFESRNIDNYLPDRVTYTQLKKPLFDYVKNEILKKGRV